MSYTVLARKYRSQTFDEIVGQDAIATTLKNAIASGRVHHGYLFTGTRGVGKTSMARILAKALNCQSAEEPVTVPCSTCDSCVSIAEGDDIDVLEIDAASNTGVDNIRELRSNANYRPARSRFKVCIIDEVHMLSTGAFNALLKTLEEPPGHVKFIFATTEAQKIPATVLSRVQRFDFRPIGPDLIADHLRRILEKEGIESDPEVIRRVSRLANGSMRDALSLLDQLLSLGEATLSSRLVDEVLPAAHSEVLARLIDHIAASDARGALLTVEETLGQGQTLGHFCDSLIGQLRTLMLLAVCGEDTDLVDVPIGVRQSLVQQSKRFDAGTYVYMITVFEELRRNVRFSGSGRALADAAVVKLCEAEKFSSIDTLLAQLGDGAELGDGVGEASAGTSAQASVGEAAKKKGGEGAVGSAGHEAPGNGGRVNGPGDSTRIPGSLPKPGAVESAGLKGRIETGRRSLAAGPAVGSESGAEGAPTGERGGAATGGRRLGTPSREDREAALNDPTVRTAMDLFQGELINVEHTDRQADAQDSGRQDADENESE